MSSLIDALIRLPAWLRTPPFPMTVRTIVILFTMAGTVSIDGIGLGGDLVRGLPVLAAILVIATIVQLLVWRRQTIARIDLEDDYLILPNALLPLGALRRISLIGRSDSGALVIETGRQRHSFLFAGATGEEAVRQLLVRIRDRMSGTRKGEEAWDRLCRRFIIEPAAAPWVTLGLMALLSAGFALQSFLLPPQTDLALAVEGAGVPARLWGGDPSILLTAALLHLGRDHFCATLLSLLTLAPPVERRLGAQATLCLMAIATMATVAASIFLCRFEPQLVTIGAAGIVFGLVGSLAALRLLEKERSLLGDTVLPLPVWLVWLGFSATLPFFYPSINWLGPLGGLVAGFITTLLLVPLPRPAQRAAALLVGAALAASILWDVSAAWRPDEAARREASLIDSIAPVFADDPLKQRDVLERFLSASPLSPRAAGAAAALAYRLMTSAEPTQAARERLIAESFTLRQGDRTIARKAAETLLDSGKNSEFIDLLLPLMDALQRHQDLPKLAPRIILHQAAGSTLPLDLIFDGRPPWEAYGLFLLRRGNDLLGVMKIVIPPGLATASPQRAIAVMGSDLDMTGADSVALIYDPLYCHCDGRAKEIDIRLWAPSAAVQPFP